MSERRTSRGKSTPRKRVLVVTGSRAEFGLLKPVMEAIQKNRRLELRVAVAGEHLLGPAHTWREVAREFKIDAKVPMQRARDRGRVDHAAACGRGMTGFAAAYLQIKPDWVVVLGDRIEAFAAASAASIGGIAVCHIHGGDRAEGIADEAMRHAITKLSHLHCAATKRSAQRITLLGESATDVHITGSPAIDGLNRIKAMSDSRAANLGNPTTVVLLHPSGLSPGGEESLAVAASVLASFRPGNSLFLQPNFDPGRETIVNQWRFMRRHPFAYFADHLPRLDFLALLRRLAQSPEGCVIGNSSAGLIECSALGVPSVDVGPRQNGRERPPTVLKLDLGASAIGLDHTPEGARAVLLRHIRRVHQQTLRPSVFGDGRAGPRIAALLAKIDPHDPALLRKRNSY